MGCSASLPSISSCNDVSIISPCYRAQDSSFRSSQIEEELKIQKEKRKTEIKLLLLGAAEAGKSTIVKQVRIYDIVLIINTTSN